MDKKKRIIFSIIFIIITILLGYALYAVFFASEETTENTTPNQPDGSDQARFPDASEGEDRTIDTGDSDNQLPASERNQQQDEPYTPPEPDQRVSKTINDAVDNVDISSDNNTRFYNEEDGKFYQLTNGELKVMDDKTFYNVDKVSWAPTEDKAILEYPDGANVYYNFETKEQKTLPKHWTEFSFSPDSNKVAAKSVGYSPDNRWLIESNPDGSKTKKLEPMGENANKVNVNWSPNRQVVAFSRTGRSLGSNRQEVLMIGRHGENFKSITAPGYDFRGQWSPEGQKVLFSVHSGRSNYKPELWIVNGQGEKIGTGRKKLNVNTWAEKCTFKDENTIYCGVPTIIKKGSGFEPSLADDIPDDIMKINTQTGAKTPISTEGNQITVKNIEYNKAENKLLITTKKESGIFEIKL